MPDDTEILEDEVFARQWDVIQRAIATQAQAISEDLHREADTALPRATHATLDASED